MYIDFPYYQSLILDLNAKIDYCQYDSIVVPMRGGFYIGDQLSRLNDKFHYDLLFVSSYTDENEQKQVKLYNDKPVLSSEKCLVIDDIYDTGNTFSFIKDLYPETNFDIAVLLSKQKESDIIYGEYIDSETWIEFWWEA